MAASEGQDQLAVYEGWVRGHFEQNYPPSDGPVRLTRIHTGNHIVWRAQIGHQDLAVRMAHPSRRRTDGGIGELQCFWILQLLYGTDIAPQPRYVTGNTPVPFLVTRWVEAAPLNSLPDREQYFFAIAERIAILAKQPRLSFVPRVGRVHAIGTHVRIARIAEMYCRMPYPEIRVLAMRMAGAVLKVHALLWRWRGVFDGEPWCLHHDGLHGGNVSIRPDGVSIFFDWDTLSWRQSRVYTLVRFITSLSGSHVMPWEEFQRLVSGFAGHFPEADPVRVLQTATWTLLERWCADWIYRPWSFSRNPARRSMRLPTEMHEELKTRESELFAIMDWMRAVM